MTVIYKIKQPYSNPAFANQAAWVAKMMAGSEGTAYRLHVSPEAIVAQAALESAWGKAAIGNNVFGIKADALWKGPKQRVHTREVGPQGEYYIDDDFRDYPSVQASIEDHFDFLTRNSRYKDNGVFSGQGDLAYFAALQRAGYATAPNYAEILGNVLDSVKKYTANMERIELSAGYTVQPGDNIQSVAPKDSTIIKDSNKGTILATAAGAATAVTPVVSAFGSLDWKVAAVMGVVAVIALGAVVYYFTSIKNKRTEMSEQGVI